MLEIVHQALSTRDDRLPQIAVRADRSTLAKRRWRGAADDGREFGFVLNAALKHGDAVFQTSVACYVIHQAAEPLLEVDLDIAPSAAAGIGWAIGNLHLELSAESTRLLSPDEPAVRQLLNRLGVRFRATSGIFRPGRFARGQQFTHELGSSHRH
jgi:urease accessory protein